MTPKITFLERLKQGPLLADGAMGTMLHLHGVRLDACFDELNIDEPERIETIQRQYIEAGADLIETNTFSANPFKLAAHGLADQVVHINEEAGKLSRRVAAESDRVI